MVCTFCCVVEVPLVEMSLLPDEELSLGEVDLLKSIMVAPLVWVSLLVPDLLPLTLLTVPVPVLPWLLRS